MNGTRVRAAALLLLVLAGGIAVATVENLHGGDVSPGTVEEDTKVQHIATFEVDAVSKDGGTDEFFVQFPDGVTLQPNYVEAYNRSDASAVSITSSVSVVDGPDGDGVKDSLTFAVSPDGEGTVDVRVKVDTYVTWPMVDGTVTEPLKAEVQDSDGSTVSGQFASVTIEDGGTPTPTATTTPTASPTPTATPTPTSTPEPSLTEDDVHETRMSPTTVTGGSKVGHRLSFHVADVSRDGSTDWFYVRFPDGVDLSPNGVSANIAGTTQGVSVTSSVSVVDGGDSDGLMDTLRFAISPDGEGTMDANVTIRTDVRWPVANATTTATVDTSLVSSGVGTVSNVPVAEVTVEESPETRTPTRTSTATPPPTATQSPTTTAQSNLTREDVGNGTVTPSTVHGSEKVEHEIAFDVDGLSRDGSTDVAYIQFPDGVTLQPNGAEVSVQGSDAGVSVSSSISVVDGPDGDGLKDALEFAVSPDGEGTVDARVVVSTYVTWPAVDGSERMRVGALVDDSARGEVPTQVDTVSVLGENATGTPTELESTPTGAETPLSPVPVVVALLVVAIGFRRRHAGR